MFLQLKTIFIFFSKPRNIFISFAILSVIIRLNANLSSQLIIGYDGGYYALQLRSLFETGGFVISERPMVFWLGASLLKVLTLFGPLTDEKIFMSIKLIDSIAIALLMIPLYKFYKNISKDYKSKHANFLSILAVFSLSSLFMIGDLVKNAIALSFYGWFIYFILLEKSNNSNDKKIYASIFYILLFLTHFGTFIFANITFIFIDIFHFRKRNRLILYISLLVIIILSAYLFSPSRIVNFSSSFDFKFNPIATSISVLRSFITILLLIFSAIEFKRGLLMYNEFQRKILQSLTIVLAISVITSIFPEIHNRIEIITLVPKLYLCSILILHSGPLFRRVLIICTFLSMIISIPTMGIRVRNSKLFIHKKELIEIGDKMNLSNAEIIGSRELIWWAAYYLRCDFQLAQGQNINNIEHNSKKRYVLISNIQSSPVIKKIFPDPTINASQSLIYENTYYSLYTY